MKKYNILIFNMQTYADFHKGIVNRNAFILENLLKSAQVNKILSIDFLHTRKKRLLKDYFFGVLSPKYAQKRIYNNIFSACVSVKDKENLFVYSTVNALFSKEQIIKDIKVLLSRLEMEEDLIVWSYNPLFVDYFGQFHQLINVFDTVDNWMTHSSHKRNIRVLKNNYQKIADRSEVIFTVSENLLGFYEEHGRIRDVFHIPNAVDISHFQASLHSSSFDAFSHSSYKKVLDTIPKPRLGYFGSITEDRVDIDLLAYIVNRNPNMSFVFAGPVWKGLHTKIHDKLSQPNVYFLGRIPYAYAFEVMSEFDVCLNPHQLNNFIRYTDPMKIYEYLSLGKPVVSSANEGLEKFKEYIYIASSPEQFHDKIQLALTEDQKNLSVKRIAWANENSYEKRTNEMLEEIKNKTQ